jgi:hypothetical protein
MSGPISGARKHTAKQSGNVSCSAKKSCDFTGFATVDLSSAMSDPVGFARTMARLFGSQKYFCIALERRQKYVTIPLARSTNVKRNCLGNRIFVPTSIRW